MSDSVSDRSQAMKGKLVLVTGANTGMGKATSLAIASMGAHVVMLCRSGERGRAAQQEVRAESGNDLVDLMLCDLGDLESIRTFTASFVKRYQSLHVLVNNAGVVRLRRETSKEGFEMTLAVNHVAPFLLTMLLLDLMKRSAPSRIVMVNSGAHVGHALDFDDLQLEHGFAVMKAYGRSKLANLLFTYELARRLSGTKVAVNAVHPGAVATDLWVNREMGGGRIAGKVFGALVHPFFRSPARGADTAVYLATSPEVEGESGHYWVDRRIVESSPQSHDLAAGARLWELTAHWTGIRAD